MKNLIFTSALFLVCLIQTQAQWGNNSYNYNFSQQPTLTVQNWDQSQIQILVDGNVQSNIGTSITINFDRPGNHHLSISKLVYNNQYRRYNNYQLIEIYHGNIYINDYSQYTAVLDQYSQLNIQNISANANSQCRQKKQWGNNNHHWPSPSVQNNSSYTPFMNNVAFMQLKQTIESKNFDDTRKEVALQAIRSNNLSAVQVSEVIKLLRFESNRLEVAKQAFLVSQDRSNYFLVNNAFTFSSSIDELNAYIAAHS